MKSALGVVRMSTIQNANVNGEHARVVVIQTVSFMKKVAIIIVKTVIIQLIQDIIRNQKTKQNSYLREKGVFEWKIKSERVIYVIQKILKRVIVQPVMNGYVKDVMTIRQVLCLEK